jgi:transposase InsO family protein
MGREHQIYQSDNGSEYVNKDFKNWVGEDRFRHGRPYSPTTQGQVLLFSFERLFSISVEDLV